MARDLAAEEAELVGRREPYARVTVVWSRSPVSARAGDAALVTPDGRLRGWVGGSCAEPVGVAQALAALSEGTPASFTRPRPASCHAIVRGWWWRR